MKNREDCKSGENVTVTSEVIFLPGALMGHLLRKLPCYNRT